MPTIAQEKLKFEWERVATLEESEVDRLLSAIEGKAAYDKPAADRLRADLERMSIELSAAHAQFLLAGRLYHTANFWAREYQIIIGGFMMAKARYEWAVEWLKVALDLALLAITLGLTNLYRVAIPRLMATRAAGHAVARQSVVRTFVTGVPRTGITEGSRRLFPRAVWPFRLLRDGMIDKALLFSIPMWNVKQAVSWGVPLLLAEQQGVTDSQYEGRMREIQDRFLADLPHPARSLVGLNDEQLLLFLARTEEHVHTAMQDNEGIMSLDENDRMMIKATALMDTWLTVSHQIGPAFQKAWADIVRLEGRLRDMQSNTWHENWLHSVR